MAALCHPQAGADSSSHEPSDQASYQLRWGLKIPLRDGVRLNATLYQPRQQAEPLPVIVLITPYVADLSHQRGTYFAQHGYVFVAVDSRGRGNSEGQFTPFVNEGRDGHDVVEWLARQPWCDGQVALWGGSYSGFNQWAILKERPPHLRTIVPAASVGPGIDFPAYKNVFYPYLILWLTYVSGVTANERLFQDLDYWRERFREWHASGRPFCQLDELVGNPSPIFQAWIAQPEAFSAWEPLRPAPADYRSIDLPILTITGHYDGDQPGAMHYYRQHMRHGDPAWAARHYLLMGPWDHAGTRTPNKSFAGLTFGDACEIDMNQLHREWYDWILKGGERPALLKDRVTYYVGAADEWRHAASLEAIPAQPTRFYLATRGTSAHSVFESGTLLDAPLEQCEPARYTADPLDLRPGLAETKAELEEGLASQHAVLRLSGDGLVYHTAPFEDELELHGQPRLQLWLALDVPDTDIFFQLAEITADGRSVSLGYDMLRARYRESLARPQLIEPGSILRYDLEGCYYISRRIARGSRLRLVIGRPSSTMWQKNYQSGGLVAQETAAEARVAHITLYQDARYPSLLELPLAPC